MILLQTIIETTQIKYLTFKVLQHTSIFEEEIITIADNISRQANLEKLDIYFRGTNLNQVDQIKNALSRMENIDYAVTKKSVHLYR